MFHVLNPFIIARAHATKKVTKRTTKKATGSKRITKKAGAKKTGAKRHTKKAVVAHHDAPVASGSAHASPAKASTKKSAKKVTKKAGASKRKAHAKK